jgi:hypothetical protein
LEFYRQSFATPAKAGPHKIGILAGSFNPPTIAHIELALAASAAVDLVVCVIPRAFPHKEYSGATLEQRAEMLDAAGLPVPHAIASTSQGLFIDIAREWRRCWAILSFWLHHAAGIFRRPRSIAIGFTRWLCEAGTKKCRQLRCGSESRAARPGNTWCRRKFGNE